MTAHTCDIFDATADMDPAEAHRFTARAMAEDHRQITAFDHAARRALIRPVQPEPQTYAWLWWAAAGLGLLAGLIAGGL